MEESWVDLASVVQEWLHNGGKQGTQLKYGGQDAMWK